MRKIEARIAQTAIERIVFVFEFPGGDCGRNSLQRVVIESQDLPHFTRCHAIAIGDYIGGHGGSALPVTPIDILNHALAFVAAGEIEVDVRPLAALFGEESLEEQFHSDGIYGGDAEGVANRAIGSRSAALHEN